MKVKDILPSEEPAWLGRGLQPAERNRLAEWDFWFDPTSAAAGLAPYHARKWDGGFAGNSASGRSALSCLAEVLVYEQKKEMEMDVSVEIRVVKEDADLIRFLVHENYGGMALNKAVVERDGKEICVFFKEGFYGFPTLHTVRSGETTVPNFIRWLANLKKPRDMSKFDSILEEIS